MNAGREVDVRVGTTEHGDVVFVDPELVMEALLSRASTTRARLRDIEIAKNGAYIERNRVLILLGALARLIPGWRVGRAEHDPRDEAWEDDWRAMLVIETPAGQMTWHFHDSQRPMLESFAELPDYQWDGHSTDEKYRRISKAVELTNSMLYIPPEGP